MAKSVPIETGSPFTHLYFQPYVGSNGFVGYLDVVTKSTDGSTKTHLRVFRGKDKRGFDEYYVQPVASHRTPLFNEDGSPLRNNLGEPTYKENVYGGVDKELRYRIKLWLTATLVHFFAEHPDGKVAEYPATNAQPAVKERNTTHVVAEDDDESAAREQGGF